MLLIGEDTHFAGSFFM